MSWTLWVQITIWVVLILFGILLSIFAWKD